MTSTLVCPMTMIHKVVPHVVLKQNYARCKQSLLKALSANLCNAISLFDKQESHQAMLSPMTQFSENIYLQKKSIDSIGTNFPNHSTNLELI